MTLTIAEDNGTLTGALAGRLDTAAAAQFAKDMQPLIDNAHRHILLDCERLTFISSSGLRLLLTLRKETQSKGGDITIKNVPAEVKQVFTITGFYTLFHFV